MLDRDGGPPEMPAAVDAMAGLRDVAVAGPRDGGTTSGPAITSPLTRRHGFLALLGEAEPPRHGSLPAPRERTRPMDNMRPLNPAVWHWQIRHGMTVYAADGGLVGTVTAVGPAVITVAWRCVATAVYSIPTSTIAAVGGRAVHLSIPMDEVVHYG
jgi:hypothetical protein